MSDFIYDRPEFIEWYPMRGVSTCSDPSIQECKQGLPFVFLEPYRFIISIERETEDVFDQCPCAVLSQLVFGDWV